MAGKLSIEIINERLSDLYPHIHMIEGQEYKSCMDKYWFYCSKEGHGAYETMPHNAATGRGRKSGCPECASERKRAPTLRLLGTTTIDGHTLLEDVGTTSGKEPQSLLRYKCGKCGNTEAVARANNLTRPGNNTIGCSECSKPLRESLNSFLKNEERANQPCHFYVAGVYCETFIKPGISKDPENRRGIGNRHNPYWFKDIEDPQEFYEMGGVDLSYEDYYFISDAYPRAWMWCIEQIILRATEHYRTIPMPNEMLEASWSGMTELRDWKLDPKDVERHFNLLLQNLKEHNGNWISFYQQHINTYKIK